MPLLFNTFILGVVALAGLLLLVSGLRVRRRGETPRCGRCEYELTGLASPERCPECGAALSGERPALVYGERYRRRGVALAGLALLLLCGAPLGMRIADQARRYDWYRLRPMAWVLDDLSTGAKSTRAAIELQRRYAAGSLERGERLDRFAEFALRSQAQQPSGVLTQEMVQFLGDAVMKGDLSAEHTKRFHRNAVLLWLQVPTTAVAGRSMSWMVREACRVPGGRMWVEISHVNAGWDGKFDRVHYADDTGSYSRLSGTGAGGGSGSSLTAPADPGPHMLTARARVAVFAGPMRDAERGEVATPLEEHEVQLDAKVDVRPPPVIDR